MTIRVVHVVTRCIAGAGGVAVRGAINLDPNEFQSALVTGGGGPQLDLARAHGIEVVLVPQLVSPISPRDDVAALARLTRLLHGADVVHTHSAKAGALGRVAGHRAGARLVHTLHGFPFHEFQHPAIRHTYMEVERRLSRITDMYFATGTGVAVEAIRRGLARPDRILTIGPCVDDATVVATPTSRRVARALLGLDPDVQVVGTVGRLDYQKAPEVLIAAVGRLGRGAVLVWVGGGPLMGAARRQIVRLGLEGRIHLLGERPDVPQILPAFDDFAMASRYEGLPCAIVEAQRCGIPVVATAVNGVPDVVSPGESGLLVPAQRPDLLAEALEHALARPELRAAWVQEARSRLGDRYDASKLGGSGLSI